MNLQEVREGMLNELAPKGKFKYPRIIASILICFRAYGQQGGIVGGAVRDFVLGKEIRDYDVYIPSQGRTCIDDVKEVSVHARRYGYTVDNVTAESEYNEEGGNILAVLNLKNKDGESIDIIFGESSMEEQIDNFTCDISKLHFDVFTGKVQYTEEFLRTENSKVSYISDNRGSAEFIIELYVDKMRRKFPEYTFIEEPHKKIIVPF